MIQIVVTNVWSRIRGLKDITTIDALDRLTSFYVEGYQFTKAFKEGYYNKKQNRFVHWDGKKHLLTQRMVFPTGLLPRVEGFLKRYKEEYEVLDQRSKIKHGKPLKVKKYTPREYQQEAVDIAVKKGRGIIRAGTGSGKTLIMAMLAAHYNLPTVIYVVGKDLLHQFHREFSSILGSDIGIIGDGQCDIHKINICSVWTAAKSFGIKGKVSLDDEDWNPDVLSLSSERKQEIKNMVEQSLLVLFDEAHFLATDSLQSIFKISKSARFIFGASATPWREDGADLLLESVCGPVIFDLPSSELIRQGWLVRPNIVMMRPSAIKTSSRNYRQIYGQAITNNDERNNMIIESARMLAAQGRKTLILVRHLSHGRFLADNLKDISAQFVHGDVDSQQRNDLVKDLVTGRVGCLVASSVFDVGVDLPELDALIMAAGGKSSSRTLQRIGRALRPHKDKKNAIIVDFIDDVKYLKKHSVIRCAAYRSEPEFRLRFVHGMPSGFEEMVNKYVKGWKHGCS